MESKQIPTLSVDKFLLLGSSSAACVTSLSLGSESRSGEGYTIESMKVTSTDVSVILQAPRVTGSSMEILFSRLFYQMVAIKVDLDLAGILNHSCREDWKAAFKNVEKLREWYRLPEEDKVETVIPNNIDLNFPATTRKASRNDGGIRKAACYDAAITPQAYKEIPFSYWNAFNNLWSQLFEIGRLAKAAESQRLCDRAFEGIEELLVNLQSIVAWYQQQEEANFEAQQVVLYPKDDALLMKSRFSALLSVVLNCQSEGALCKSKAAELLQKNKETFQSAQRTVRRVETDFDRRTRN